jgi:GxxExxY protein
MEQVLQSAAEDVHDVLGDGWSETIYHTALQRELSERGVAHHSEGTIPVMYRGAPVGRRRPDMFLIGEDGDTVIVELKAGSSSGKVQLEQYLEVVKNDNNYGKKYGRIVSGAVIRFNEDCEFEYYDVEGDE